MKILKELLISWSPEISLGEMTECNCLNCKTPVINFDKIKDFCCTKEKYALPSLSSVDCLYFDEHRSTLYLLECKDFQQYKKTNQDREFRKMRRHNTGLTKQQKQQLIEAFTRDFFANRGVDLTNNAGLTKQELIEAFTRDFMEFANVDLTNNAGLTEQQLAEAFTRDFFAKMEIDLTKKVIDSYALLLAIVGEHAKKFSNDSSRFSYLLNNNKLRIKYFVIVNMSERDYVIYGISNLSMSYSKFRFLNEVKIVRADDVDNLIQISHSTD